MSSEKKPTNVCIIGNDNSVARNPFTSSTILNSSRKLLTSRKERPTPGTIGKPSSLLSGLRVRLLRELQSKFCSLRKLSLSANLMDRVTDDIILTPSHSPSKHYQPLEQVSSPVVLSSSGAESVDSEHTKSHSTATVTEKLLQRIDNSNHTNIDPEEVQNHSSSSSSSSSISETLSMHDAPLPNSPLPAISSIPPINFVDEKPLESQHHHDPVHAARSRVVIAKNIADQLQLRLAAAQERAASCRDLRDKAALLLTNTKSWTPAGIGINTTNDQSQNVVDSAIATTDSTSDLPIQPSQHVSSSELVQELSVSVSRITPELGNIERMLDDYSKMVIAAERDVDDIRTRLVGATQEIDDATVSLSRVLAREAAQLFNHMMHNASDKSESEIDGGGIHVSSWVGARRGLRKVNLSGPRSSLTSINGNSSTENYTSPDPKGKSMAVISQKTNRNGSIGESIISISTGAGEGTGTGTTNEHTTVIGFDSLLSELDESKEKILFLTAQNLSYMTDSADLKSENESIRILTMKMKIELQDIFEKIRSQISGHLNSVQRTTESGTEDGSIGVDIVPSVLLTHLNDASSILDRLDDDLGLKATTDNYSLQSNDDRLSFLDQKISNIKHEFLRLFCVTSSTIKNNNNVIVVEQRSHHLCKLMKMNEDETQAVKRMMDKLGPVLVTTSALNQLGI